MSNTTAEASMVPSRPGAGPPATAKTSSVSWLCAAAGSKRRGGGVDLLAATDGSHVSRARLGLLASRRIFQSKVDSGGSRMTTEPGKFRDAHAPLTVAAYEPLILQQVSACAVPDASAAARTPALDPKGEGTIKRTTLDRRPLSSDSAIHRYRFRCC